MARINKHFTSINNIAFAFNKCNNNVVSVSDFDAKVQIQHW